MSDLKVKIFVSHRIDLNSETIDNPLYIPVRCGAVYDERSEDEINGMLGDDTGDSISEKRKSYCELTVLYWAWKNVKADYYGLCHYRRFLSFSSHKYPTDEFGNVIESQIDDTAIKQYKLDIDSISNTVNNYDIITGCEDNVRDFPGSPSSIREHYKTAPDLNEADIDILLDVISEKYPEYYQCAKNYFEGSLGRFCLLFVMKKDLFNEFCEWLFTILNELDNRIDMSQYTTEGIRTPGHLAERLFGIFVKYQKQKNKKLKICERQRVVFLNTERIKTSIKKAQTNLPTIPIVLSSSEAFVPAVSTVIQSIIENADDAFYYDIIVITREMSQRNRAILQKQASKESNISIRIFDATGIVSKYDLKASNHISVEAYYRFLIPYILPEYDKVLYLDSDIICCSDVSELYNINLGDKWIGATKDPDYIGQMCLDDQNLVYCYKTLRMKNPYDYFQAGVLLMNTKQLRKSFKLEDWLGYACNNYKYMDQDILNRYCEGNVLFINMQWNMLIDCNNYRVPVLIKNAPDNISTEYANARENPKIIHYAGHQKPWNALNCDKFEEFWQYARKTPFYERLYISLITGENLQPKIVVEPIGVKGALVNYFRKHTPRWLRPFAKWVKKILKW